MIFALDIAAVCPVAGAGDKLLFAAGGADVPAPAYPGIVIAHA